MILDVLRNDRRTEGAFEMNAVSGKSPLSQMSCCWPAPSSTELIRPALNQQVRIMSAYIALEKRLWSKRAFTGAWPYGA